MMNKISKMLAAFSLLGILAASCQTNKVVVNREVESKNDGKMLLGPQLRSQLEQAPYSDWYTSEYDSYKMDPVAMEELRKAKLGSYSIVLVFGTWCEDSHREVPRFMKILDTLKYPEQKLTLIAVNRKKEAPNGEEGQYNIQRVPTIILKKYGKEIGRIVEYPQSGWLEKDLLDIIKKDHSSLKDQL